MMEQLPIQIASITPEDFVLSIVFSRRILVENVPDTYSG